MFLLSRKEIRWVTGVEKRRTVETQNECNKVNSLCEREGSETKKS